ncbi:MAG: ParA family protein [Deltaproteobacteria bacterium]|nr:ParA family protein [Deltaproteobacteria bacterium]
MRRIAFINEKGGSCKTTLAVNTAAYFAGHRKRRVLLVDMDPQGQAGKSLGFYVRDMHPSVYDVLIDPDLPASAAIRQSHVEGLDVLVANKTLSDFPLDVAQHPDRERKLADKLAAVDGYDFVIYDSPPSMGIRTHNIMLACEEVVVPVNLTYFALDGCAEIVETVERMRQDFGKADLQITLVVPTLYRPTRLADEILTKLRKHFPGRTARTIIGYNVKIDEAQSHGKTIWEYASWSRGAHMLESLAKEIWRSNP